MSSQLIWLLTKDNNSFLVKRNGITFNRAPGNLTRRNTFTDSPLAQKKGISIRRMKNDKKNNQAVIRATTHFRAENGSTKVQHTRFVVNDKKGTLQKISELGQKVNKMAGRRAAQRAYALLRSSQ